MAVRAYGVRRLGALIKHLPLDAAVWREDVPRWSVQDELSARLIEVTDLWGRVMALTWGRKRHELPPVAVIEHPERDSARSAARAPDSGRKKELTTDPAEIARFLRARRGG